MNLKPFIVALQAPPCLACACPNSPCAGSWFTGIRAWVSGASDIFCPINFKFQFNLKFKGSTNDPLPSEFLASHCPRFYQWSPALWISSFSLSKVHEANDVSVCLSACLSNSTWLNLSQSPQTWCSITQAQFLHYSSWEYGQLAACFARGWSVARILWFCKLMLDLKLES